MAALFSRFCGLKHRGNAPKHFLAPLVGGRVFCLQANWRVADTMVGDVLDRALTTAGGLAQGVPGALPGRWLQERRRSSAATLEGTLAGSTWSSYREKAPCEALQRARA